MPTEPLPDWNTELKGVHQQYLALKRKRQQAMDVSTTKRARQETLYDQPLEDKKRTRVTGPFTVESLSPHLVLDPAESNSRSQAREQGGVDLANQDYHTHILEHLKTAGVQSRSKDQRITFEWLEEHPGEYIHAAGVQTDEDGKPQSIAISIGPEYDTVGSQWINAAAKAAMRRMPKFEHAHCDGLCV